MERRTYTPRPNEVERKWYIVDAEGKTLGRRRRRAAMLRGKTKPTVRAALDTGDFVIVVNAEKIVVTGKKETQKFYYRHSGYPGGLNAVSLSEMRHATRSASSSPPSAACCRRTSSASSS